jgi:nitrite reductase/ring-hydroxylating ferredoxin subunit
VNEAATTPTPDAAGGLVDVCDLDALVPGVVQVVELDGRPNVGVVLAGGKLRAFGLLCPHRGGPLEKGVIRAGLSADAPGERTLDPQRCVLACPWHKWEYSLQDGRALFDQGRRLIMYPTVVQAGRVRIALDRQGASGGEDLG